MVKLAPFAILAPLFVGFAAAAPTATTPVKADTVLDAPLSKRTE